VTLYVVAQVVKLDFEFGRSGFVCGFIGSAYILDLHGSVWLCDHPTRLSSGQFIEW